MRRGLYRGTVPKAADIKVKRKSRKRRYIQNEETLTVGEVVNLLAENAGSSCDAGEGPSKRVRAERHCGTCGKTGHNSRTCTAEIEDASDSEGSNE